MSHPGIYVRGATVALTRRTTMRKAFLAPWDPLVENIRLWFLAVPQAKTGVAIHAAHDVVTHHHTRVTPSSDNLPEFLRVVHGETSCALNTLLAREGYDAPGEIFDDRPTHRLRLLDAEAQASHHVYEHLNTTDPRLSLGREATSTSDGSSAGTSPPCRTPPGSRRRVRRRDPRLDVGLLERSASRSQVGPRHAPQPTERAGSVHPGPDRHPGAARSGSARSGSLARASQPVKNATR